MLYMVSVDLDGQFMCVCVCVFSNSADDEFLYTSALAVHHCTSSECCKLEDPLYTVCVC